MITKEDLDKRHGTRIQSYKSGKSHYGSEPSRMYVGGSFNEFNWNGGDGIIRQFTDYLEDNQYHEYTKEFEHLNYDYELISKWQVYEDMKYVTIVLRKYCLDDEDEGWSFDTYLIVYCKNRGRTDEVHLNGKRINYDGYVHFLNIIKSSGFIFDMNR